MASRELSKLNTLHICSGYDNDCYSDYPALANQNQIIDTARLLNSLGYELGRDDLDFEKPMPETYFNGHSASYSVHSIIGTVDVLLDWLEESGGRAMTSLKKREAILRGVLHLTGLGSKYSLIGMLQFACEFLDVPDDPYPSEREYISGCLAEIEEQKERIFEKIEQAGDILMKIIDTEGLDITKGMQFDNLLREANVELDSCRRRLDGARQMIDKLMKKMQSVKWFSRAVRVIGLVITCYFFYYKYQSLSISFPIMVIACFASLALWVSLFPGRARAFNKSLSSFDAKHRLLTEGLDSIHERMKNSSDYKDSLADWRDDN